MRSPNFSLINTNPTKKSSTVLVSAAFQVLFVAVLLAIPLIFTDALPRTMLSTMLVAPPPPPPPPPPAAAPVRVIQKQVHIDPHMAPVRIPNKVVILKEAPTPPPTMGDSNGVPGGIPGGSVGVLGGVIGGVGNGPIPPPAPHVERIRQGGNVTAAKLTRKVDPVYPPLARQTRITGTVRLHAIIGKNGNIQALEVVSGHPLLIGAAMSAVQQWKYSPTMLNGEAVEVDTTIDVIFNLS